MYILHYIKTELTIFKSTEMTHKSYSLPVRFSVSHLYSFKNITRNSHLDMQFTVT